MEKADSSSGNSPRGEEEKKVGEHTENGGDRIDAMPDPDHGASDEERARIEKQLKRKLDFKLIPWLTLLYLASFLDRTNIGNAKVVGLLEDLHISDGQYTACLSIFFVSYAGFEPLTNVLIKRFRPSVFIPVSMTLWGVCMTCMGLVKGFSGLAATRFFLGMCEAGLFPGVAYYLSCWYKRSEFGIRLAIFFSAAALAGSFGGLLAAGIAQMDGVGGKPGWAWIFILEGLATVVLGVISYWMIHDFPDEATFLSVPDRQRVLRRLAKDQQASSKHEDFKMAFFWEALKDWKTWCFAIIFGGCDGALYAFSLFTPTIIEALGFEGNIANLLSVPPYACAALLTIIIGWYADRSGHRGWCNIGTVVLGIVGFAMQLGSKRPGVKYAAVFLGAMGIYPCVANTVTWTANNIEGSYKRGIVMGLVVGFGNINGVVSSNIYRAVDAPRYFLGHGVVFAYLVLFLFGGSILTHFLLQAENKKRKEGKRDAWFATKNESEIELLGDKRPDFLYII